jgi:hypothetical protein
MAPWKWGGKRDSYSLGCTVVNYESFDFTLFAPNLCRQSNTWLNFLTIVSVDIWYLFSTWLTYCGPPTVHKNMAKLSIELIPIVDFNSVAKQSFMQTIKNRSCHLEHFVTSFTSIQSSHHPIMTDLLRFSHCTLIHICVTVIHTKYVCSMCPRPIIYWRCTAIFKVFSYSSELDPSRVLIYINTQKHTHNKYQASQSKSQGSQGK